MTDPLPLSSARVGPGVTAAPNDARVERAHAAAVRLEATFLAEMLKAAGLGEQAGAFSGGTGEDQFASFHREAVAQRMAEAGGIGLAEHFFQAIMEAQNDKE